MKHSLSIGAVVALSLCLAFQVAAQPPQREKPNFERLEQELGLTDEQSQQLQTILVEAHEARKAQHNLAREERHAARQITRERIAEVLDEEQMHQFDAMHERRAKRGKRRSSP